MLHTILFYRASLGDLDFYENGALDSFIQEQGLHYQKLYDNDRYLYSTGEHEIYFSSDAHDDSNGFYWTRSWDGCIENMANGMGKEQVISSRAIYA
jgi:hypothetical protein